MILYSETNIVVQKLHSFEWRNTTQITDLARYGYMQNKISIEYVLASLLPPKNDVSLELKRRITLANIHYYALKDAHPSRASLWHRGIR